MLPTLETPEIIIGLCSPIGADNAKASTIIRETLLRYGYQTEHFKVTTLMKGIKLEGLELHEKPLDERYDSYINYANKIRELTKLPYALAVLCSMALRSYRRSKTSKPDSYVREQAYIFDQFKRREEIDALRQIYGRLFILVSIYSDKEIRIKRLAQALARDNAASRVNETHRHAARMLERRDEDEEGVPSGQRLRDAFPLADVFINIDDENSARNTVERFFAAFFGSNKVSPTRDEYGMYIAKSAALRSLDLSRQVGAAVFSDKGEIISLGSNEVPKAGGGTYWADDATDYRDYRIERDENERIKRGILADVVRRLRSGAFVVGNISEDELIEFVISEAESKGTALRDAQLMDLIEFGRIIHAEMSAISDAARKGVSTKGAYLFCTTFPCHICAKHIVAAGLKRVVYIEPYPKSYAEDLHSDSIILGINEDNTDKVQFSPFIGISPYRFRELFERGRRKSSTGAFEEWRDGRAKPSVRYTLATYLENEIAFTKRFVESLAKPLNEGLLFIEKLPDDPS